MKPTDVPPRTAACGPVGIHEPSEAADPPQADTWRDSAAGLYEHAARLQDELARTFRDLAKHAQIRLAVPAESRDIGPMEAATSQPAQMLTVQDLADLAQVGPKTIRRWREEGILPSALDLPGVVRWSAESIEAWLRGRSR